MSITGLCFHCKNQLSIEFERELVEAIIYNGRIVDAICPCKPEKCLGYCWACKHFSESTLRGHRFRFCPICSGPPADKRVSQFTTEKRRFSPCKFESFEKLNNYVKDIDAGFAGLLWSLQSNRLCISKNALMFARVLAKFYREPMRAFLGPVFLQVAEALFNNHQYDGSRLTQMAIVTSVDLLRLYKDQSSDFLDPLIGKLFLHSHIRHSTDRVVEAIMTNISPIFLLPKILNFIGNDDENIQFQTARWFRSILDKLDLVGFDHHQIGKLIQIVASKLDQLEVHKDCAELILHEVESKMGKSNFGRICVEVLPPESVEIVLEATLKCARKFEEAAEAELKLKESEQTFTLQL